MKKFNLLLALALITLTAALVGCGKDNQDGAVVNAPGYNGYAGYQYPPQNCVNGNCTCNPGMNYQQNGGANGFCQPGAGWNGFGNSGTNPCYMYGPYAQPTYYWGQTVCVIQQNTYQSGWSNRCQLVNYGGFVFYSCFAY